jgi:hypothetical protein
MFYSVVRPGVSINVQRMWLSENKAMGVFRLETIRSDIKTIFVTFLVVTETVAASLCALL